MVDIKQALVTSGDSLEDETRSVILALGSKAVAPLLEIFEDEALRDEDGPAGLAPVKAAALLGEIGDPVPRAVVVRVPGGRPVHACMQRGVSSSIAPGRRKTLPEAGCAERERGAGGANGGAEHQGL